LSDDEHVLAVAVHHVVGRRLELRLLSRELAELYRAPAMARVAELPVAGQLGDYSKPLSASAEAGEQALRGTGIVAPEVGGNARRDQPFRRSAGARRRALQTADA